MKTTSTTFNAHLQGERVSVFSTPGPCRLHARLPPLPQLWLRPDRLRPCPSTQVPISIIAARVPERQCIPCLCISTPILLAFAPDSLAERVLRFRPGL